MDAQVSYAFHSERKLHPEKFKNQTINQVLLFKFYTWKGNENFSLSLSPPLFVNLLYYTFDKKNF